MNQFRVSIHNTDGELVMSKVIASQVDLETVEARVRLVLHRGYTVAAFRLAPMTDLDTLLGTLQTAFTEMTTNGTG